MEEFTSLSTGCFAVRPPKKRSRSITLPLSYKEECNESLSKRYTVFYKEKECFDEMIETILKKVNKDTVSKIVKFISKSQQSKFSEIHTLTIQIGVNFQEFSPIYEESSHLLFKQMHLKSAILNAYNANDVSNALKNIFMQVLSIESSEAKILLKTLSMKGLFSQILAENQCSGLVIFIPRFDVLPSGTMDKLVNICSSCIENFQIFFVLGLATGTELSEEWILSSTLSQLQIETISLPSPTTLLEEALCQTLLSTSTPLKLSYRTFEVLLSKFSFSSYSLHDVIKTVKVALLNHCLHQPLFRLVECNDNKLVLNFSHVTSEDKALILQLPSVQNYIEKMAVSNKILALEILKGDENSIQNLFSECIENYTILFTSFKVLHIFLKNIPGNNLVSKPLELYSFCIQGSVHKIKEICIALKCFGMLEAECFIDRLKSAEYVFESYHVPQRLQLLKRVIGNQIKEMESVLVERNTFNDSHASSSDEVKGLNNKLEKLQTTFVSRIENFFSTLGSPTTWPMHEITWYTNYGDLQNIIAGKCRTAIHRGLTNPNLYLQSCETIAKPGLCYLYEIFHEHGRLISLYDWIQSFNSILDKKKISNEIHAMFIRCVSELHFMGYLKPTKRKTDHVAKLTLMGY